ncbi:vacuolar fusion protein MON1 homolog isoform X2 [Coffea eugenioides]|uniref:Vacuolar fusion protein MON1 homolog n=1 Tax=Coffea arabica TaxID=13443 RepID=A0A6P6U7N1_COFAR|nr:vacuolar fusion protein MON1 homolog isoform X2 [Coffea arabica]XP_027161331.1 vacuolar fusion protein MON1 homolog isoform X2 [Coffea eugenioides]
MPSPSNSSSYSSSSDEQNPNSAPNPNPPSIDQSLDAIENQLASISTFQPGSLLEPESEFGVNDDEIREELVNGSINEIEELPGNSEEKLKVSSSRVWANVSEMEEGAAPSSPSSSGYAGERGSSATSGVEEDGNDDYNDDEIVEVRSNGDFDGVAHSPAPWTPGKRHGDEDDDSISWRKRKKHFFILSHSGKPIYSRYGDEHKLAGFSATLQAIISFVENGGDRVKLVRAGKHQVVFLVKGPIYLVCISCTEEPYESLRGQLELLYGQMILILTKSVNRCFEKNPKFDMTPLLGGTDVVFSSLIHSFNWNPATFLHAYTCLPLAYATRQAAGAILQDVADSGVLFAILMCRHKVICLVGAQKASLHPDDMLLLSNFVVSSESFRTSESFSPICLPRYNPMAFLYAYVHYFDVDTYLILLTTSSDAFYHLKDCRIRIETVLLKSNVLVEVQKSMLEGRMHVEDLSTNPASHPGIASPHLSQSRLATDSTERLTEFIGVGGPAGLWHFMYRSIYLNQYVSSEFALPINSLRQQKRLYRAYQKLYASMHEKDVGPHKTQFRRDENYALLCWVTQDFELYAAFDPLADKALAIKACNRVCQWVKDVENEIFLLGASPFSW